MCGGVSRRYDERDGLGARWSASVSRGGVQRGSEARSFKGNAGSEYRKRRPVAQREEVDGSQAGRDDEHGIIVVAVVEEAADPGRVRRLGIGKRDHRNENGQQHEYEGEERDAP
jgi:hypothetical protein